MSYARRIPVYHAARMPVGTLARFCDGLTWRDIYALDNGTSPGWWRGAVVNAEIDGQIVWLGGAWWLTDAGRRLVLEVA